MMIKDLKCSKCGSTDFENTCQCVLTNPPKYKYKCRNCGAEIYLDESESTIGGFLFNKLKSNQQEKNKESDFIRIGDAIVRIKSILAITKYKKLIGRSGDYSHHIELFLDNGKLIDITCDDENEALTVICKVQEKLNAITIYCDGGN